MGLWAGLTFICLYDLMEKYAKLIFVDKLGKMYMKRFKMHKAEEKMEDQEELDVSSEDSEKIEKKQSSVDSGQPKF